MRTAPKINILLTTLTGIFVVFVLNSCAPVSQPDIEAVHESGELKLGMTKDEVQKIVPQSSWTKGICTKRKITKNAEWELWDFASPGCGSNPDNHHALVFKNGELVEIREVSGAYASPRNYEDLQLP